MLGITLNFGGAAIFNGDQDAAGVRAIVRAGSVDDALHLQIIGAISPASHRETEENPLPSCKLRGGQVRPPRVQTQFQS
jgi:hypothetical protein